MTKYILDHSAGRDCTIMYEGKNGVTRRNIHVLSVDEHRICGLEENQLKTFRRDRILAATWQHAYSPSQGQYVNNSPDNHTSNAR